MPSLVFLTGKTSIFVIPNRHSYILFALLNAWYVKHSNSFDHQVLSNHSVANLEHKRTKLSINDEFSAKSKKELVKPYVEEKQISESMFNTID